MQYCSNICLNIIIAATRAIKSQRWNLTPKKGSIDNIIYNCHPSGLKNYNKLEEEYIAKFIVLTKTNKMCDASSSLFWKKNVLFVASQAEHLTQYLLWNHSTVSEVINNVKSWQKDFW